MGHNGILLRIKGKVQGVGFRPVVWQLARQLGLTGDVSNNGAGVEIRLLGDDASAFIELLRQNCPPLAVIDSILAVALGPVAGRIQYYRQRRRRDGHPDRAGCGNLRRLSGGTQRSG
jgi:hydrogenase maturation factor HypF (carbamoyltransferase family)